MADTLIRPHVGAAGWLPRRTLVAFVLALLLPACVHIGHLFTAHAHTFRREAPALKGEQITLSRAHAAMRNVRVPRKVGQLTDAERRASERKLAAAPFSSQHQPPTTDEQQHRQQKTHSSQHQPSTTYQQQYRHQKSHSSQHQPSTAYQQQHRQQKAHSSQHQHSTTNQQQHRQQKDARLSTPPGPGTFGRHGGLKEGRNQDGHKDGRTRHRTRPTTRKPFADLNSPQLAGAPSSLNNVTTAPASHPVLEAFTSRQKETPLTILETLLRHGLNINATMNATINTTVAEELPPEELPPDAMAYGDGLKGGVVGVQAALMIVSKGFVGVPGVGDGVHCGRAVQVDLWKGAQRVGEIERVAGSCIAIANGTAVNIPQTGNATGDWRCHLADDDGRCEEYGVSFSTASFGAYQLSVVVNGRAVAGSPFPAYFYPELSQPFFNASTLFPSTDDVQYGDKLLFTLMPRNFKWQHTNSCDVAVTGLLTRPDAARNGTEAEPGVRAAVSCRRQAQGAYYVLAIDDKVPDGAWQMSVLMQGRHVDNSPLLLTIRPLVSAKMSELAGEGLSEAIAGQAASVALRLVMHTGLQAADCRESATLVLVEQKYTELEETEGSLTPVGNASVIPGATAAAAAAAGGVGGAGAEAGAGAGTGAGAGEVGGHGRRLMGTGEEAHGEEEEASSGVHKSVVGSLDSCFQGLYNFSYAATAAGKYSLSVLVGRDKTQVMERAFPVAVLPAELSAPHCGIVNEEVSAEKIVYGQLVRFGLYLRDAFGNYISCAYYKRGLPHHNVSGVAVYHEGSGDVGSTIAWSARGALGKCSDNVYTLQGRSPVVDGVIDVTFRTPVPDERIDKEVVVDLEVAVNGKRLKEGPYPTFVRPARLDPAQSIISGSGTRGGEPEEEQVLVLQTVNEVGDNMTTCSSSVGVVGVVDRQSVCEELHDMLACAEARCQWLAVPPDGGTCSAAQRRDLVEVYLVPLDESAGNAAAVGVKIVGHVQSCNHGLYTLSYAAAMRGRYSLHIKLADEPIEGSPFRVVIAPGCRSGAVLFPCLGRGLCMHSGHCECADGYLGVDCETGCPGLGDDGVYCSDRGNCSADPESEEARCQCRYGYLGATCERECPGGAFSICSGNGKCEAEGECECFAGYSGDKCQFKSKEVRKFGSGVALAILLLMTLLTVALVVHVLIKKGRPFSRKASYGDNDEEYPSQAYEEDSERARSGAAAYRLLHE